MNEVVNCHCNALADYSCPGDDGECDKPLCPKCGARCSNEKCNTKYCDGLNCHTLKHCEHEDCDYRACGDLIEAGEAEEQCGIYYNTRLEQFFCHLHRHLYQ